ncbi:MAG: hypothetical protein ABSH47_02710 [Bryobacteraceae bacterium]|jgi:hypothetical protein
MHNAILIDRGCERGIVPTNGPPNRAVDAFFDDACAGVPIDLDSKRTATFTGRFRSCLQNQSTCYALEIENIENITIVRSAGARASHAEDALRTPRLFGDPRPPLPEPPPINAPPGPIPNIPEVFQPTTPPPAPPPQGTH